MAQLQSTCVIGTLAISSSHSNAQQAIMIGGGSNNAEFSNQSNLIAIGENTALSGSGALNPATLTITQEGSGFCAPYNYYSLNNNCSVGKPVVLTGGGGGTGACFGGFAQRYDYQSSGVTGDIFAINCVNLGSGYTSTVTGTVCDPCRTTETCEIFTIEPYKNNDSINIGHNAGCRATGNNTVRIGTCAGRGNLTNGFCYQIDSIAIGKNTMVSGSFEGSVVIGHNSFTGNNTGTNFTRCQFFNTIIGNNNFPSASSRVLCTTVIGYNNLASVCCSFGNTVIGFSNALAVGTQKRMNSNNVILGSNIMCCSANGTGNVFLGLDVARYGCLNIANCNIGIGSNALARLTTGDYNIAIGYAAGCCNTSTTRTISIGQLAGALHCTGNEGLYIGPYAGYRNCAGDANVVVGGYSFCAINNNACRNQIFGYAAASCLGPGSLYNTLMGHGTALHLRCNTQNNIYIGSFAGYSSTAIDGNANNIVIGYYAGRNYAGDNNIIIGCGMCCSSCTSLSQKFHLGNGVGNCLLVGCLNSGGRTLGICGTLSKTAGSFQISHPDPVKTEAKDLWHSFVESPTAGDNLYRFEVEVENSQATIDLPDYYKHLNENDQVWVNAKNHFGKAYGVVNQEQTTLTVFADTDGEYNVLLIGTRKDKDATKAWKGTERLKEN